MQGRSLAVHDSRHNDLCGLLAGHLEVSHQRCRVDGLLSEATPYLLDSVIQLLPALHLGNIGKEGQLDDLVLGAKVDGADGYGSYLIGPPIAPAEQIAGGLCNLHGALGLHWQLALELSAGEVVAPYRNLHTVGSKFVDTEPINFANRNTKTIFLNTITKCKTVKSRMLRFDGLFVIYYIFLYNLRPNST